MSTQGPAVLTEMLIGFSHSLRPNILLNAKWDHDLFVLYPTKYLHLGCHWTLHILELCNILCFVDRASLYNLVNKANSVHNFSQYVYFFSLRVSGDYVPIFRRNNCIYATLGFIPPWILDSHPYRIQSTKCRINTVISLDDGHIVARNM